MSIRGTILIDNDKQEGSYWCRGYMEHARRKFMDIIKTVPSKGLAHEKLHYLTNFMR